MVNFVIRVCTQRLCEAIHAPPICCDCVNLLSRLLLFDLLHVWNASCERTLESSINRSTTRLWCPQLSVHTSVWEVWSSILWSMLGGHIPRIPSWSTSTRATCSDLADKFARSQQIGGMWMSAQSLSVRPSYNNFIPKCSHIHTFKWKQTVSWTYSQTWLAAISVSRLTFVCSYTKRAERDHFTTPVQAKLCLYLIFCCV